jgi:hypothetical protein
MNIEYKGVKYPCTFRVSHRTTGPHRMTDISIFTPIGRIDACLCDGVHTRLYPEEIAKSVKIYGYLMWGEPYFATDHTRSIPLDGDIPDQRYFEPEDLEFCRANCPEGPIGTVSTGVWRYIVGEITGELGKKPAVGLAN